LVAAVVLQIAGKQTMQKLMMLKGARG
jgi:hypothetical protein